MSNRKDNKKSVVIIRREGWNKYILIYTNQSGSVYAQNIIGATRRECIIAAVNRYSVNDGRPTMRRWASMKRQGYAVIRVWVEQPPDYYDAGQEVYER